VLLTALGAFLGATLSLFVSAAIEYLKKPRLQLAHEDPPVDQQYAQHPAKHARFVRVRVKNLAMPTLLRWLGRAAAYQCIGYVRFHHIDNGAPLFSKAMPVRWSGSAEPVSVQVLPDGNVIQVFDPVRYDSGFRRDCFPGSEEIADVAAKFDDDEECYGWSNETYLPGKGWRNQDYRLPKGRYIVVVTIQSAGENISEVFQLENSLGRQHFRLLPATAADRARVDGAG
jgi:hypothetical protein